MKSLVSWFVRPHGYLLVAASLLFVKCSQPQSREYFQLRGFTQGTTYSIIYYQPERADLSSGVDSILAQIDTSMSLYNPASSIVAFNNSKKGAAIDPLLAHVVELSLYYNRITGGAFDITVGSLVRAWGFHGSEESLPDSAEVQSLLSLVGSDLIALSDGYLSKAKPGVIIDANAIAQGYAVDVISEYFEHEGVTDYLVEVGGEIRTFGKSPRGDKWVVGVDRPEDNIVRGEALQVKIALSGESIVTSGNYRKFYEKDGVKYSHTIDPETGSPVNHSLLSATVIDATSAGADALATAFMVMGIEGTKEWLQENGQGIEVYLVYSDKQGKYREWMTKGIKDMIVE